MNRRLKLVTSFYPFHDGPPFWGQPNRDRWYKYSLACICNSGEEVVCYTDEGDKGYNHLIDIKSRFNLTNLTIKVFKLEENPYQDRVVSKRMKAPEKWNNPELLHRYQRSQQIYWMKFIFLEMELQEDYSIYWIDSGLSHHGLFPPSASKYGVEPEFKNFYGDKYWENEYKLYWYDKAFTSETFKRIDSFSKNKIIQLYRGYSDDNPQEFKIEMGYTAVDYQDKYAIAGFFGGSSELMKKYLILAKEMVEEVLNTPEYLCSEQDIMTHIQAVHPEWFTLWEFDTFYHEGWAHPIFVEGKKSFSYFFLKNLD